MRLRNAKGATLSLIASLTLVLLIIGSALFYLTKILGGSKQVANATDAGAISAAKQLESVTVDLNKIASKFKNGSVPLELSGLGVDSKTGAPDPNSYLYNIYAYNRAVGAALIVCANAQYEASQGSTTAVQTASQTVADLQVIGDGLTAQMEKAITASGAKGSRTAPWTVAAATAAMNNTNLMGGKQAGTTTLVSMGRAYLGANELTQSGKTNVYFNSNLLNSPIGKPLEDLTWGGKRPPLTGILSPYPMPGYAATSLHSDAYQSGQPFVPGYSSFSFGGQKFYGVNVNPDQNPHLIGSERFNNGAAKSATLPHTPFNSTQTVSQTTESNKTNLFVSAVASAVMGSLNNSYPVVLSHGFILLSNDHSYKFNAEAMIGTNLVPASLNEVPVNVGGTGIFNNELWEDTAAGGGGEIDAFQSATAPGGVVFGVRYGSSMLSSTKADKDMGSLYDQIAHWWCYYFTPTDLKSSYLDSVGNDKYGHDSKYDPTGGLLNGKYPDPDNLWIINKMPLWQPNDNARVAATAPYPPAGTQDIVQASAADMASIVNVESSGYERCRDYAYTIYGFDSAALPLCARPHLTDFEHSYGEYGVIAPNTYSGDGNATAGLTALEYMKGLVITGWVAMFNPLVTDNQFTLTIPSNNYQFYSLYNGKPVCSGSHLYDRNYGYAQPMGEHSSNISLKFGGNGTPLDLLNQIANGGSASVPNEACFVPTTSTCPGSIDLTTSSPLWNLPNTIQGQLLQRVQEIDPSQTPTTLSNLLSAPGTNLDLGWSDVIFFDDRTGSPTYNTLTIACYDPSNLSTLSNFPSWLQTQLQSWTSGNGSLTVASDYLDGASASPVVCANQPLDLTSTASTGGNGGLGSIVNAAQGISGNQWGDYELHASPFEDSNLNNANSVNLSADGVTWTPNSGRGGLLGQMLFQQRSSTSVDTKGNPIQPFANIPGNATVVTPPTTYGGPN
jgi:hypothetical protein